MKKQGKRLWSILLCLVVLSALMTVTAFAAEEIEELTLSFMTPSEIPAVGEPIKHMSGSRLTEEDDRIELTGNILLWCIDDSSTIINKTYDDTGMYYEAGRTYNSEIVVEVLDPEQYTIGENTKITLTNPGDFTYTSEISSISAIGSSFFAQLADYLIGGILIDLKGIVKQHAIITGHGCQIEFITRNRCLDSFQPGDAGGGVGIVQR